MSKEEGTGAGIDEPGGDQGQDPTAIQADSQVSDSSESPGRASDDYVQRLQTDHEFAVEQAREWQKKFGRKNSEYDKVKDLGVLTPYADSVGGADTLRQHLDLYDRFLKDPGGRAAIESFARTGQLPTANQENETMEDEWIDPAEKRVQELERELADVRTRTARMDMGQVEDRMKGQFATVFKSFPGLQGELREKVMSGCMQDIKQYGMTDSGRDSLRNMNEDGARAMMLRHLTPEELHEVVDNARRQHNEEKKGFATHEPPGVSTTGGGGDIAAAGENAFLAACREIGVDPNKNPLTDW